MTLNDKSGWWITTLIKCCFNSVFILISHIYLLEESRYLLLIIHTLISRSPSLEGIGKNFALAARPAHLNGSSFLESGVLMTALLSLHCPSEFLIPLFRGEGTVLPVPFHQPPSVLIHESPGASETD